MADSKSVDKVVRILELLSDCEEGLTLSEISRKLDIPKTSAYDILKSLYKEDAVYYLDPIQKKFVIGAKMYKIGMSYSNNSALKNSAKIYLNALAAQFECTALLYKRVGNIILCVDEFVYDGVNCATSHIGSSISHYHTNAFSKCFFAFDDRMFSTSKLDFKPITKYSETNSIDFEQKLEIFQAKGYTDDVQETEIGLEAYAVPIYNFENYMVGSIGLIMPYDAERHNLSEIIMALKTANKNISKQLGCKIDWRTK